MYRLHLLLLRLSRLTCWIVNSCLTGRAQCGQPTLRICQQLRDGYGDCLSPMAVVLDVYSRRVVGWSVRPSLAKELATSALKNAIEHQRPRPGLIHHSDRGSQYTSYEYQQMLRREGITISMSRSGSCHDNAPTESFFGTLKTEMHLRGDPFNSHAEARRGLFEYIEVFYNRQRRHSTLGYKTPMEFEQQYINRPTTVA